ncbi:valine--tRNA ligase-like [Pyrus ussuriensis x Pyrus communis]|uniref:valine--tRNA ligase n=1 Tax=Pyrus ussuriensis x Pyrus communis TaxID=2448454 RepID=A0A5N5GZZ9_9ROSA|nr:valine--tRNA ligase-like [Pyrus ussuriensis x Pyrus communis]
MRLGICSRSKDVVEPKIKPQWYVKCSGMGNQALDAAIDSENRKLEIIPRQYTAEWLKYLPWLENIRDWCISRQLWWGHRVPAWYVVYEMIRGRILEYLMIDGWLQGMRKRLEHRLDTEDLKAFYPTSLLETGHDILFFWVSRMVMLGMALGGDVPFTKVYLHPMIRDAHGCKMSKSLGNVIDPLDVINGVELEDLQKKLLEGNLDAKEVAVSEEVLKKDFPKGIKECGTDALRFALVSYTAQHDKINLDIKRVEGYKSWCNKLWNVARFSLSILGNDYVPPLTVNPHVFPFSCQWILSVLNKAISKTVLSLESYELSDAATAVHAWWQYQLCDVFVEAIKPYFSSNAPKFASERGCARDTLWLCLDNGLRLLHPFMPFVTEELWQRLPSSGDHKRETSIMICEYPSITECWTNEKAESEMNLTESIVQSLRSLTKESHERRSAIVICRTISDWKIICSHQREIETLAHLSSLTVVIDEDGFPTPTNSDGYVMSTVNKNISGFLNVPRVKADPESIRQKMERLTL